MTVGKKDHLKLAGGRALRLKFKQLFKMGKPLPLSNMYIVFVISESNDASSTKKMPWKVFNTKGTSNDNDERVQDRGELTDEIEESQELAGVRQFVLVIPDTVGDTRRRNDSVV